MKRLRKPHGFTLIELIVVILILGILATIAVIGYTNITNKAQDTTSRANAVQMMNSLAADVAIHTSDSTPITSVDAFLAGPALTDGGNTYATAQDYLNAKFAGVTETYDSTAHTIVVGPTGHQVTVSGTDKAIPTVN